MENLLGRVLDFIDKTLLRVDSWKELAILTLTLVLFMSIGMTSMLTYVVYEQRERLLDYYLDKAPECTLTKP